MRPILQGNTGTAHRHSAVYHSCSGRFAMRQDDWVFIDAPSGDDNNEPEWFKTERGYTPHEHPGELFNLRDDLTERRNLYGEHPQIVRELSQALEQIKGAGSTPTHAANPATPQSE